MVIQHNELKNLREQNQSKRIVLGSGVFDLLHYGHVSYLQALKSYGDIVVVMVKGDERVRLNKHPSRPIIPEHDRVRMVEAIKGVDYAFVGPYDPTAKGQIDHMHEVVLEALRPDVFVVANNVWEKLQSVTNVKIVNLPRISSGVHNSTTAIVRHIRNLSSSL